MVYCRFLNAGRLLLRRRNVNLSDREGSSKIILKCSLELLLRDILPSVIFSVDSVIKCLEQPVTLSKN